MGLFDILMKPSSERMARGHSRFPSYDMRLFEKNGSDPETLKQTVEAYDQTIERLRQAEMGLQEKRDKILADLRKEVAEIYAKEIADFDKAVAEFGELRDVVLSALTGAGHRQMAAAITRRFDAIGALTGKAKS